MLARDPDVIIDMGEMAQTVGITERQKRAVVALWRRYPTLKAVRSEPGLRGGLRHLRGARAARDRGGAANSPRMLHPEVGAMSALFSLRGAGDALQRRARCCATRRWSSPAAQMVAIVGPNGAGKSTLLGIMAGLAAGLRGRCLYEDREVRRWPRRAFAREVSFVPQSVRIEFPFTAEQVVMMGRTPYCDGLFESPEDRAAVERAMADHRHAAPSAAAISAR